MARRERDEEREIERLSQYLVRVHGFREPKARALAYRWQGYSHSGIARRIDTTEATVLKYLDEIEEEYGPEAILTPFPEQYRQILDGEFDPLEESE